MAPMQQRSASRRTLRSARPALIIAITLAVPMARAMAGGSEPVPLDRVRQALGGDKLEATTTLSLEGTYRRQLGEREISGDLEFAIALPDKFLRVETMSLDPTNPIRRVSGFNGTTLIESLTGGGGNVMSGRGGGPGGQTDARRLLGVHRDFARVLIAFLVGSASSFPLDYR